jgi:hypothetical protein
VEVQGLGFEKRRLLLGQMSGVFGFSHSSKLKLILTNTFDLHKIPINPFILLNSLRHGLPQQKQAFYELIDENQPATSIFIGIFLSLSKLKHGCNSRMLGPCT